MDRSRDRLRQTGCVARRFRSLRSACTSRPVPADHVVIKRNITINHYTKRELFINPPTGLKPKLPTLFSVLKQLNYHTSPGCRGWGVNQSPSLVISDQVCVAANSRNYARQASRHRLQQRVTHSLSHAW